MVFYNNINHETRESSHASSFFSFRTKLRQTFYVGIASFVRHLEARALQTILCERFLPTILMQNNQHDPRDDKRHGKLVLTKIYIYHALSNNCNCLVLQLFVFSTGFWKLKEFRLNKSPDEKSVFLGRNQTKAHPTILDKEGIFNWQQNRWNFRQNVYINYIQLNRSPQSV